jgi:hypothetical protein
MPGFLLHQGATIMCAHAGQAMPTAANAQVTVSGMPTVVLSTSYTVAGCALPPPPAANGPCVTAQYVMGAQRVTSNGQPLLLLDSQSICVPTGTPLLPAVSTQTRVTGM